MTEEDYDPLYRTLDSLRVQLDRIKAATESEREQIRQSADHSTNIGSIIKFAEAVLSSRNDITSIFRSTLFADPATNICLRLYIDRENGDETTSGACCLAAGVPRTTALRLINVLSDHKLIEMYIMRSDRRSTVIRLTVDGIRKIEEWLTRFRNHLVF